MSSCTLHTAAMSWRDYLRPWPANPSSLKTTGVAAATWSFHVLSNAVFATSHLLQVSYCRAQSICPEHYPNLPNIQPCPPTILDHHPLPTQPPLFTINLHSTEQCFVLSSRDLIWKETDLCCEANLGRASSTISSNLLSCLEVNTYLAVKGRW